MSSAFYSDRTSGAVARNLETVPERTWRGIYSLVLSRLEADWFAELFPVQCPDGRGVYSTNRTAFFESLEALVPAFEWPLNQYVLPEVDSMLDFVDFAAQRVSKPSHGSHHSYFEHYELKFDPVLGRAELRRDINELFARGGVAFEVSPESRVVRLGPVEGRQVVADLVPNTGDDRLDELIGEARERFLSRNRADESAGLERLWDAFERMKTIAAGDGKKQKATALLDDAATGYMREVLEAESRALTVIGNQMQIRHFETDKHLVEREHVDYLFVRLTAFMVHVLRSTGRLGG